MKQQRLVIDADSHKCENPVVFPDYIPAAYRDRLSFFRDRYGEQRFRILDRAPDASLLPRVFLQPDGLGKGTYRPYHEETTLGGLFNHIRLEHMEREGIDGQVIYGSIPLAFGSIVDAELAVALCRAYNDYIYEDCEPYRDRLHPVAVLPLQDPGEAVAEMKRCVEELGLVAVMLPPHLPEPHPAAPDRFPDLRVAKHLSHPDFRPVLREAERLGVAIGIHGAPGVYLAGGMADQLDTFTLVHAFANRHMQQVALAKLVFDGVLEEFPRLRFGFLEAGCGWLPDLMHTLREHWEKRIVGLDPTLEPRPSDFVTALLRERSGRRVGRLAKDARVLLHMLFTASEQEVTRTERESFLYEHPRLRRDPVEYLERGQIFVSFESDDPAVEYLPSALGPPGERVACMAVDYGHWDATLKNCVGLVADRPGVDARYADRLLSGNAIELYGEPLQLRIAAARVLQPRRVQIARGAEPPRFDPFRILGRAERETEIAAVRGLLEERDGPIDLRERRLPLREARLIALMRDEGDAPPPGDRGPRPGPDYRGGRSDPDYRGSRSDSDSSALWCTAIARVNGAENYGSRMELKRVFSKAGVSADAVELHVLLEERIHSRILKEICRNCGVTVDASQPPRSMRWLIHGMQHLPDALRYVLILCGEALGCVVFQALRDASSRLVSDPSVEQRCRLLLDEIITDELLHTRYCRARVSPLGMQLARRLAPLVAASFVRDVPQLRALGWGPPELVASLRRGIEIPPALASTEGANR